MAFSDIFEKLLKPGEDGIPDTLYDDLSKAHLDEVGGRDAKIADLGATLQAAEGEISRLKMHNYDLLMAIPAEGESADGEPDADEESEESTGVDSLFEDEETN